MRGSQRAATFMVGALSASLLLTGFAAPATAPAGEPSASASRMSNVFQSISILHADGTEFLVHADGSLSQVGTASDTVVAEKKKDKKSKKKACKPKKSKKCKKAKKPKKPAVSVPAAPQEPTVPVVEQPPAPQEPTVPVVEQPPAPQEPATSPAAGVTPGAGDPNAYAFMTFGDNGVPLHWDRCSVIRYRINPANVSQPMLDDTFEAIRRLSVASGVQFRYVGTTDVIPFRTENWYDGLLSKSRDTDLYIAYADPGVVPGLAGASIGIGGPVWLDDGPGGEQPEVVLGGAVFDASDTDTANGFGPGHARGGLILHELGHVMNLGHVSDSAQVMFPERTNTSPSDYQAGDLNGLRLLASYPCS